MSARTLTVAAIATAGLIAIGGGTALAAGAGGSDQPITLTAADTAPPGIDRAAAERIAIERVGGGRITDRTELDDDDRRQVWEVEVTNGTIDHDLDVDAATGEIVEHDIDDLRNGDDADDRGRDDDLRDGDDDHDDQADDRDDDRHDDDRGGDDRHDD